MMKYTPQPSSKILKFNLRPDLYAHASWLQDLLKIQKNQSTKSVNKLTDVRSITTQRTSSHQVVSNHTAFSDSLLMQPKANDILQITQLNPNQRAVMSDSNSGLSFIFAEYLLKRYGLYQNYCWNFDTPLKKVALHHDIVLLNNYIIALMYCHQIRQTIYGPDYCIWLKLLTKPVMDFSLFQAPYLPMHDLPDLAVKVNAIEHQLLPVMQTSIKVMKYLFSDMAQSIWLRLKLHFPRQVFLHNFTAPDLSSTKFHDWFVQKIVKQELAYAIY